MRTLMLYLLLVVSASAQSIVMKDGKVITAKSVRRDGDTIMATMELPPAQQGGPAQTGEFGYQILQIAKIDFPEPPQFKTATDLIVGGNATEALAQLEPVLRYYEGFRDAPGSWWADAELLKLEALVSLDRDDDAVALATDIVNSASNPETAGVAKTYIALGLARHGDFAKAMEMNDAVLNTATSPRTLASAAVNGGRIHLARKEWEHALLSFLEVPVFYPEQKVLMPHVLLGCGRAYTEMKDFTRAKTSLNELAATYGSSPEAAQAKLDLEKIAKLEKSTELPK